jgi:hypothetical protein
MGIIGLLLLFGANGEFPFLGLDEADNGRLPFSRF